MNSLFQTLSKGELADIDKAALVGDMRSMVAVLGSIPAGQSYFLMFSWMRRLIKFDTPFIICMALIMDEQKVWQVKNLQ